MAVEQHKDIKHRAGRQDKQSHKGKDSNNCNRAEEHWVPGIYHGAEVPSRHLLYWQAGQKTVQGRKADKIKSHIKGKVIQSKTSYIL
jgi:hypothetical protein